MCPISVPNLKEINKREGCFFLAQSCCCKSVWRRRRRIRRKMWRKLGNFQKRITHKLLNQFSSKLVCKVMYINCTNLIIIGPVVVEIWGVENSDLVVPVNNTLVLHVFLGRWHTTVCLDFKCQVLNGFQMTQSCLCAKPNSWNPL